MPIECLRIPLEDHPSAEAIRRLPSGEQNSVVVLPALHVLPLGLVVLQLHAPVVRVH